MATSSTTTVTVTEPPSTRSIDYISTYDAPKASVKSPVNIAVVKYWGKRDGTLNLPTNSSISVTLSPSDLCTHTTVKTAPDAPYDTLSLNGGPAEQISSPRTLAVISALRSLRTQLEAETAAPSPLATVPLAITTKNNFPTAAGIASSASGYSALTRAIATLFRLPADLTTLSRIARQGSGSACRSLHSGFVQWHKGTAADGADSQAEQLAPASHWPELCALILVASAATKAVGSSEGMSRTVATSALFAQRVDEVVPAQVEKMRDAIARRDWEVFARVTMQESNNFHATCADSFPPIWYISETSQAVVRAVDWINGFVGRTVVCYTFDAGPNAVLFYRACDEKVVEAMFGKVLRSLMAGSAEKLEEGLDLPDDVAGKLEKGVCRVISTRVGDGAAEVKEDVV